MPLRTALISASSLSLSEKNLAVICISRSSSLTSTVSLALLARTSSWSICNLGLCAHAVIALPANKISNAGASFHDVWKKVFIARSSYLMLIANHVELRRALRLSLREIEFGADQTQGDQHLFFFGQFFRR